MALMVIYTKQLTEYVNTIILNNTTWFLLRAHRLADSIPHSVHNACIVLGKRGILHRQLSGRHHIP